MLRARKFSAVFGTLSANSSKETRPKGSPSTAMSKKTVGLTMARQQGRLWGGGVCKAHRLFLNKLWSQHNLNTCVNYNPLLMPVSVSAASECIRICHDSGFFCGEMGFVALYLFFGYAGSLLQPTSFLSLWHVGLLLSCNAWVSLVAELRHVQASVVVAHRPSCLHGTCDLSSLTRDGDWVPCHTFASVCYL